MFSAAKIQLFCEIYKRRYKKNAPKDVFFAIGNTD